MGFDAFVIEGNRVVYYSRSGQQVSYDMGTKKGERR